MGPLRDVTGGAGEETHENRENSLDSFLVVEYKARDSKYFET